MLKSRVLLNAILAWAAILFLPQRSFADGDQASGVAAEVEKILESGWKPSQANYDTAKQHYDAAKSAAPGDVRVPYAMALVAMQNHRTADASVYLDEALAGDKPLLPVRRAKI